MLRAGLRPGHARMAAATALSCRACSFAGWRRRAGSVAVTAAGRPLAAPTTTRGPPPPRPPRLLLPSAWRWPPAPPPPHRRSLATTRAATPLTVSADVALDGAVGPLSPAEAAVLDALTAGGDAAAAAAAALRAEAAAFSGSRAWPAGCDASSAEVSVLLARDAAVAALNAEWRGKAGPTDVLSFPMDENGGEDDGGGGGDGFPTPWAGPDAAALRVELMAGDGGEEEEEDEDEDEDEEGEEEHASQQPPPSLPPRLLGDVVISLDTAARQAEERGHSLLAEVRVLLVHGCLHLVGFDHEVSDEDGTGRRCVTPADAAAMAAAEAAALAELGWGDKGLIAAAEEDGGPPRPATPPPKTTAPPPPPRRRSAPPRARALALDLDGTLLRSDSRACADSAAAVAAAAQAGVAVIIATGKARPAAAAALAPVGLAAPLSPTGGLCPRRTDFIVSPTAPGVFLQGLASYGRRGVRLPTGKGGQHAELPPAVVAAALAWADATRTPLVAFTGDGCVAPFAAPEVESLHTVYHEPRAAIVRADDLVRGQGEAAVWTGGAAGHPPPLKLIFLAPPAAITSTVRPHWDGWLSTSPGLVGGGAETVQAVADMLEVVPAGTSKWGGLAAVLADLGIDPSEAVAVGDGGNDVGMLAGVGRGVAMGNAVPAAVAAAGGVVVGGTNDEGGVAEAVARWVL